MTTQLDKYTDRLKYADWLIQQEATGNPKTFAEKLKISESHLYNLLEDLRLLGMPIVYNKTARTYYYSKAVQLQIEIRVVNLSDTEAKNICGGVNFLFILMHSNFIGVCSYIFALQSCNIVGGYRKGLELSR
jgi:hypothetical protein